MPLQLTCTTTWDVAYLLESTVLNYKWTSGVSACEINSNDIFFHLYLDSTSPYYTILYTLLLKLRHTAYFSIRNVFAWITCLGLVVLLYWWVCSCTFGTYFLKFHAITGSGALCFGDLIIPANSFTASWVWVFRPGCFAVLVGVQLHFWHLFFEVSCYHWQWSFVLWWFNYPGKLLYC